MKLLTRLLDVLEKDSYKEVTIGDKEGNPPFGGAILGNYPDKDYPLVLTGHNTVFSEHTPVFHGEVRTSAAPARRTNCRTGPPAVVRRRRVCALGCGRCPLAPSLPPPCPSLPPPYSIPSAIPPR